MDTKYVYLVLSPRAIGLSIGLDLNPVVTCNLDCLYCEVDRSFHADDPTLDNLDHSTVWKNHFLKQLKF